MLDFVIILSYYKGYEKRKQLGNDTELLDHNRGYLDSERMEKSVNPSWAKKYKRCGGVFGVSHYFPRLLFSTTLKIIRNNA